MKILAFSDPHLSQKAANTLLTAAKDADLILGVGDFAQRRGGLTEYVTQFADWGARAIFTSGNNESDAELRDAVSGTGIQVLHGECVEVDGVIIAGIGAAVPPLPPLPWQSYDLTEAEAADLLAPITHADILISHSPPKVLQITTRTWEHWDQLRSATRPSDWHHSIFYVVMCMTLGGKPAISAKHR
ncbi:metallophosphoesterase [Aliiroseovarius sp. F20344]|uniref:metallophosphoesterase family protein n=1 Tax=Aliiroseovarius sp. F20344 TaxID=2926414 RepID=UPI001FF69B3E|nr:metallophosphoesterase [Aliiroseovarius sp. F20344]MCK0140833.1 metallophosphoesterase [Aliiroseovarius sp. F20344]